VCALTRCTVLPGGNPGRQTLAPAGSTRGGSGGDEWSEALREKAPLAGCGNSISRCQRRKIDPPRLGLEEQSFAKRASSIRFLPPLRLRCRISASC
jgi:hypothetical protein